MMDFTGVSAVTYEDGTVLYLRWLGKRSRPRQFSAMAEIRTGELSHVRGHLVRHDGRWYAAGVSAQRLQRADTYGLLRSCLGSLREVKA